MYARVVGSCRIKIEDFSLFIIRNHLSLHLLLSVHSSSQVKPTLVLFPLLSHRSLTLEPPTYIVACSGVVTPFDLHCRLGHPSLPLLKSLYSQFSRLSSLNFDSCQYAKFHRVHLSPF